MIPSNAQLVSWTAAQRECLELLLLVFSPAAVYLDNFQTKNNPNSITCTDFRGLLSTFNAGSFYREDYLTRLVLLAHDRKINVSISPYSKRRIRLTLTKMDPDNGGRVRKWYEVHPSLESAVAHLRKVFSPKTEAPW